MWHIKIRSKPQDATENKHHRKKIQTAIIHNEISSEQQNSD